MIRIYSFPENCPEELIKKRGIAPAPFQHIHAMGILGSLPEVIFGERACLERLERPLFSFVYHEFTNKIIQARSYRHKLSPQTFTTIVKDFDNVSMGHLILSLCGKEPDLSIPKDPSGLKDWIQRDLTAAAFLMTKIHMMNIDIAMFKHFLKEMLDEK